MSVAISESSRSRQAGALLLFLGLMGVVWTLANGMLTGSSDLLIYGGMAIAMLIIVVSTLNDWRVGFYLFIVWLLFEDLARKFLGNGTILFFGKDVVAGIIFLSLFRARASREISWFRPTFVVPLSLFFGLALIQVFNTWSPSVIYGFLGLKLYFYYVPLMYVGYALMRTSRDLERFLVYNIGLGLLIAGLGIAQSILGFTFLNPDELAPELQALGKLTRESPLTRQALIAPTAVFVSAGRYDYYIILVAILAVGAQAYLLLTRQRRAAYGFLGVGVTVVAAMQSGSRGAIIYTLVSTLVLSAGFIWGAPWKWGQGHRLVKALRRSILVGAAGLFLMVQLFPTIIGANWAFYFETLSPTSSASQLQYRIVDYPVENLRFAFQYERWPIGYGTGTASLGLQYVAKLLGQPPPTLWVENGFGQLMLEMGILAPFLWIIWSVTLLYAAWKIVLQLRQTVYFPVGLAIFWYAFLLLFPFSYGGMAPYQNFVMNAYFWVLIGVLFRLPHLARAEQTVPSQAAVPSRAAVPAVPVFAAHAGRS
jgi:hypothetical protein